MGNDESYNEIVQFVFPTAVSYAIQVVGKEYDTFLADKENSALLHFSDIQSTEHYLASEKTERVEKARVIDCRLESFTNQGLIDCSALFDFWNACSEISVSLNLEFLGSTRGEPFDNIYDKLFYGLNLPSIVRGRPEYNPSWTQSELVLLVAIVKSGFDILAQVFPEFALTFPSDEQIYIALTECAS